MKLPSSNDFRCCGCGAASIDEVKPCECITMVGARGPHDARDYTVFKTRLQAEREKLSDIIKADILGVHPEDQAVVLEERDWMLIIGALEARG